MACRYFNLPGNSEPDNTGHLKPTNVFVVESMPVELLSNLVVTPGHSQPVSMSQNSELSNLSRYSKPVNVLVHSQLVSIPCSEPAFNFIMPVYSASKPIFSKPEICCGISSGSTSEHNALRGKHSLSPVQEMHGQHYAECSDPCSSNTKDDATVNLEQPSQKKRLAMQVHINISKVNTDDLTI